MPFIIQQLTADGVGSDGRVVLATAVLEAITHDHIATMTVNNGGSGYAIGDTMRLNAGTPVQVNGDDFHATARVSGLGSPESAGVVTEVKILSAGSYTGLPTVSPITSPENFGAAIPTTTLTGAGSGLTLDVTSTPPLWTEDARTNLNNGPSPVADYLTDGNWLCTSVKATNPPLIGMESDNSGAFDAVRMVVGSSYDNGLPWRDQPGSPPSSNFWLSCPNQNPTLYLSTTERRVNILITNSSLVFRQYGGVGLFIPFVDVDSNYPFPSIIHGQSTSIQDFTQIFTTSNRGIVNPIDFSSLGCYQYRDNISTGWLGITEENGAGAQTAVPGIIWPNQGTRSAYSFNKAPVPTFGVGGVGSDDMTPGADSGGSATEYEKHYGSFNEDDWFQSDADAVMPQGPQPYGFTSQLHFTVQVHIIACKPSDTQMVGIVDGYEAIHLRGISDFDEIEAPDGRRYVVFSDTGSTVLYNGVAMEMI